MPKAWGAVPCDFRNDSNVCDFCTPETVGVNDCWDCERRVYTPPNDGLWEHYRHDKHIPPRTAQEQDWLDSLGIGNG